MTAGPGFAEQFVTPNPTTPDQGDERRAFEAAYRFRYNVPVDAPLSFPDVGQLWNWWRIARAPLLSAAKPVAQPVVDQKTASVSDNGSCGSQVSDKPVAQEAMRRDRETDRARFPDPEFNRWLDDSVADGVCVWDTIDDVQLAWIAWNTRDSYKSREAHMTVLDRDAKGVPTIWCDPEIADIVAALNTHGLKTVASCSGHGQQLGIVSLADGRELTIGTTAGREGVVHDWPACAVFRGGLCTCDAGDVAPKTGLDHFVADVEAALAAPHPSQEAEDDPKQNWAPYLSDRADGVRGHFAIARWNTRGYREVWNLRTHQWSAFSDEVLTQAEAEAMLKSISFAAPHPPASAEAGKWVEE